MDFSFSLSFFLPWFIFVEFSGFSDFVFFEKFLILCFCLNRFSIVVVSVFGWISF